MNICDLCRFYHVCEDPHKDKADLVCLRYKNYPVKPEIAYKTNQQLCFTCGTACTFNERFPHVFIDECRQYTEKKEESVWNKQVGGDHYKKLGVYQPWIVLHKWLTKEEFRGAIKATASIYLAREKDKGGRSDMEKAYHTIGIYLELTKGEDE